MKKMYLLSLLFAVGIQAADDPMSGFLQMMLKDLESKMEALETKQGNQNNQKQQKESGDPFKRAIKAGDCVFVANYLDEHGNEMPEYAVHTSIKSEQKDVLQLLLDRGADINKKYKGKAPLHVAAKHPEMLNMLLNAGALTEALEEQFGSTPLYMACLVGNESSCSQLLARNASVRARSYYNATPLHAAVHNAGSVGVIKQLLDAGSQINARDEKGRTPLVISIVKKHQEAVLYLIDAGADVNMQDNDGDAALHYATGFVPNIVIARALLVHKADIAKTNKKKRTPLHMAACEEIVQELIAHGADVWATDGDGKLPLERAKTREVKQLLIDVMKTIN